MRQSSHANREAKNEKVSRPQSDAQILEAAHRLVELYLVYLREHETGNDIFDTRELPTSKDALVNAFRVVIATENRPNVRALLVKAGMTLAQFQDNIGEPLPVRPVADVNGRRQCSNGRIGTGRIRKFDRVLIQLDEERVRLGDIFQSALRMAENKPVHHA
ncbi:hypothetical protein E2F50_12350 [Rhizobium deserti]|uniref:Uncharacterized protein n=1 Tax=Rhizobium deserti TaxID=2547961 RepID=A0A4R5UGK9_9HYPH|nr:hypothetical protein [Rhizobium deserti]TDK35054.1 hypothetical protein E2F50_12350 [Rhizobium deserti]